MELIRKAIEEPLRWIATNAGQEGSIVVQKVKDAKGDDGYNAGTDKYENLVARRRHRPGQGRAHGAPERLVDRVAPAHHRSPRLRDPRGEEGIGRRRRPAAAAAWAGCTESRSRTREPRSRNIEAGRRKLRPAFLFPAAAESGRQGRWRTRRCATARTGRSGGGSAASRRRTISTRAGSPVSVP